MNKIYRDIRGYYSSIKKIGLRNIGSPDMRGLLMDISQACFEYLRNCTEIPLVSKVQGKSYIAFEKDGKHSRAIRADLFGFYSDQLEAFFQEIDGGNTQGLGIELLNRIGYSIAIGFCAVIDLEKSRDQKTPGTFFEYFVGFCAAQRVGLNPKKSLDVLNMDQETKLPTDFVFDLGKGMAKYHVPVKTSTRERVIQVWAHQRVLDGVYGTGRFMGLLVCLSETKLNHRSKEVVEICLPLQWQLYQLFIAQMKRVYYFDLPDPYAVLSENFPKIQVKTFGDFLTEIGNPASFD